LQGIKCLPNYTTIFFINFYVPTFFLDLVILYILCLRSDIPNHLVLILARGTSMYLMDYVVVAILFYFSYVPSCLTLVESIGVNTTEEKVHNYLPCFVNIFCSWYYIVFLNVATRSQFTIYLLYTFYNNYGPKCIK
jgi:hypothetical protein